MTTKHSLTARAVLCVLVAAVGVGAHVLALGSSVAGATSGLRRPMSVSRSAAADEPIIVDHTCTDLGKIPAYWIEQAKDLLRVSYGHTSHGSQPVTGMSVLENGPLNIGGLYDFNTNGAVESGVLSLANYTPSGDLGSPDRTTWETRTRTYLDGPGSDRNVVVWSWCGQADTTAENMDLYLDLMKGLEQDYPDVAFVYMTGHLEGTGETGNLHLRNEQIRAFVRANNGVLFDFADIESYDPDGDYFLDLDADDVCNYDGGNWADEWCAEHPGDPLCATCSCSHSRPLNCNLKGRAFWWMMARLAGWSGVEGAVDLSLSTKGVNQPTADQHDVVTYTIQVASPAPTDTTVSLTDQLPADLSYVPQSLRATGGAVDDSSAPMLAWSGLLSPTTQVTVTYAATVTAQEPQAITNTVTIGSGSETLTRTVTLIANPRRAYLPLVLRQ